MSKQNHLSKDFFVEAPEHETRQAIMGIPQFINNITFINEDRVTTSLGFLYKRPSVEQDHCINVSILPLTNHQARVMLRISYANGQFFQKDTLIYNALLNFESAVHAAVNGSLPNYKAQEIKTGAVRTYLRSVTMFFASVSVFFLSKKVAG